MSPTSDPQADPLRSALLVADKDGAWRMGWASGWLEACHQSDHQSDQGETKEAEDEDHRTLMREMRERLVVIEARAARQEGHVSARSFQDGLNAGLARAYTARDERDGGSPPPDPFPTVVDPSLGTFSASVSGGTTLGRDSAVDHSDHGNNGPDDHGCPCRDTPLEEQCASQGCGFCRASINEWLNAVGAVGRRGNKMTALADQPTKAVVELKSEVVGLKSDVVLKSLWSTPVTLSPEERKVLHAHYGVLSIERKALILLEEAEARITAGVASVKEMSGYISNLGSELLEVEVDLAALQTEVARLKQLVVDTTTDHAKKMDLICDALRIPRDTPFDNVVKVANSVTRIARGEEA